MKKYICSSKVVRYPGMAGWYFIGVDKKNSAELKERHGKGRPGFGSIPIKIRIGKTEWTTSIFPDKRSGCYLLPLKASVRKREDIEADDTVKFAFVVDTTRL